MDGAKRSIHVHCVVLLSQVLLSQVVSLFFFVSFRLKTEHEPIRGRPLGG